MVRFGTGVMAQLPRKDKFRWQLYFNFARSCGCGKTGRMMASAQFAPDVFSRRRISLAQIDAAVSARLSPTQGWGTRNLLASSGKSECIWPNTCADPSTTVGGDLYAPLTHQKIAPLASSSRPGKHPSSYIHLLHYQVSMEDPLNRHRVHHNCPSSIENNRHVAEDSS